MQALSVKQPYALLLCEGAKTVEVRSWPTDHRGDLLICASAAPKNLFWKDSLDGVTRLLPAGCAMGVVELLDVRLMTKADDEASCWAYAAGAYAWVVRPKYWARPAKLTGRLGLFDVPDNKIVQLTDTEVEAFAIFENPPQGVMKLTKTSTVFGF